MILRISPKMPDFVRVQATRFWTEKTLYSKLEFYAENENNVNCFESTLNFNIMFKFKLQDNQCEEHYILNWNFMPKTEKNKIISF